METAAEKNISLSDTATKGETVLPTKSERENVHQEELLIYVLGPPGSGKSTQCSKFASQFGFSHLSIGDLLQEEIESGSQHGTMIEEYKREGKLVPSEIVATVLDKAMKGSKTKKFLVDGFPRNHENLAAAENIMKIEPDIVLYFDCHEEESVRRLLKRNQGRDDDNIETIRKRLKVYYECTVPMLDYYASKGKLRKIDAGKAIDDVFEDVKKFVLELSENATEADI